MKMLNCLIIIILPLIFLFSLVNLNQLYKFKFKVDKEYHLYQLKNFIIFNNSILKILLK